METMFLKWSFKYTVTTKKNSPFEHNELALQADINKVYVFSSRESLNCNDLWIHISLQKLYNKAWSFNFSINFSKFSKAVYHYNYCFSLSQFVLVGDSSVNYSCRITNFYLRMLENAFPRILFSKLGAYPGPCVSS